MIRLILTLEQRDVVQVLRRDSTLRPTGPDRVQVVLLSAEGWSPPGIAVHLGCHPATVRQVLKRFAADGSSSVQRRRPGPPKDFARPQQVTAALDRLLARKWTWTAAPLAAALWSEGIALSARQTRKYLKLMDPAGGEPSRRSATSRTPPASSGPVGCGPISTKGGRRATPTGVPR